MRQRGQPDRFPQAMAALAAVVLATGVLLAWRSGFLNALRVFIRIVLNI